MCRTKTTSRCLTRSLPSMSTQTLCRHGWPQLLCLVAMTLARVCCQAQHCAHWPQTQQAGLAVTAFLSNEALILRSASVTVASSFTIACSFSAICLSSSFLQPNKEHFTLRTDCPTCAACSAHERITGFTDRYMENHWWHGSSPRLDCGWPDNSLLTELLEFAHAASAA